MQSLYGSTLVANIGFAYQNWGSYVIDCNKTCDDCYGCFKFTFICRALSDYVTLETQQLRKNLFFFVFSFNRSSSLTVSISTWALISQAQAASYMELLH